jgi:hypothetical protein
MECFFYRRSASPITGIAKGRQNSRSQDADDGDHHKQFDQSEAFGRICRKSPMLSHMPIVSITYMLANIFILSQWISKKTPLATGLFDDCVNNLA